MKYVFFSLLDFCCAHLFSVIYSPLRLFCTFLLFSDKQKNKNISQCLVYLPPKKSGWILSFLWKDLSNVNSKKVDISFYSSFTLLLLQALRLTGLKKTYAIAFLTQQDIFNFRIIIKFLSLDTILFYTHSKLNNLKQVYNFIRKGTILSMNLEQCQFLALNFYDNPAVVVLHFPIGIQPDKFLPKNFNNTNFLDKDIDVLFVGRYQSSSLNPYYFCRKRSYFTIKLAKILSNSGLKVAILGSGWSKADIESIEILDLPYNDYPRIYSRSKIFCSPALQEGGPISFLEALASNCLILSTYTGFICELPSSIFSEICVMNHAASLDDWNSAAIKLLTTSHSQNNIYDKTTLINFLEQHSFQSLNHKLHSIIISLKHSQ